MKTALILYPNQLFARELLPDVHTIIMVEEPLFFGVDQESPRQLHRQKLILHRASMRRYTEEVLWPAGIDVDYVDLDVFMSSGDVFDRCRKFEKVYIFDPVDELLTRRLLAARRERAELANIEFLQNPSFYLKDQEVRQYFADKHQDVFTDFYQWQRERFNILIGDDYKPLGGDWLLSTSEPVAVPKDQSLPNFGVYGSNKYVDDAVKYVSEHFPGLPGSDDFVWPTNHAEAATWLQDFVNDRLDDYAKYNSAIDGQAQWLYHSALGSSLNSGLLTARQVVEAALKRHAKQPVELTSLESFIRQTLGWREFVRGQYLTRASNLRGSNPLKANRKLSPAWYSGGTGLPPLDDMITKLLAHGYATQTERQTIAGNLMILCEIAPEEMQQWLMTLLVDAYDWVVLPSVFNLNQLGDSSSALKPVIAPSSSLLTVSHYERGDWSDTWDGLYWRFIDKHQTTLKQLPALRPVVQRLNQLDPDRRRIINYRAEDFLNKYTN